jgi:hypothetical protein
MVRVVQRAYFHASAASGAKVVIDIFRILNDNGVVSVGVSFNTFDAGACQWCDKRVTSNSKIEGTELEIDVLWPFKECIGTIGKLQKMSGLADPDNRNP